MVLVISFAYVASQTRRLFDGLVLQGRQLVTRKAKEVKLSNVIRLRIDDKAIISEPLLSNTPCWLKAFCGRSNKSKFILFSSKVKATPTQVFGKKKLIPFYALVGFLSYNDRNTVVENELSAYSGERISNDIKVL